VPRAVLVRGARPVKVKVWVKVKIDQAIGEIPKKVVHDRLRSLIAYVHYN
jgi:hypothetical protein